MDIVRLARMTTGGKQVLHALIAQIMSLPDAEYREFAMRVLNFADQDCDDLPMLEHVIELHVDDMVMIPQRIYSRWLKAAIDMDCQTRDLAAMHVVVALYPQHVNTATTWYYPEDSIRWDKVCQTKCLEIVLMLLTQAGFDKLIDLRVQDDDLCFVRWVSVLLRAVTRNVDIYIIEAILDTGVYYHQPGLLSNFSKPYSDKQRMRLRDFFRYFNSDYKQTIIQLAEECSYQTSLICSSHLKSRRILMRLDSLHLDSEFGGEGRYSSLPYFLPQ
jgi:hypothetical protein